MKKDFWGVDVDDAIKKAERWLLFNPPKKDYTKFLCNWFNRSYPKPAIALKDEPKYKGRGDGTSVPHSLYDSILKLSTQMRAK